MTTTGSLQVYARSIADAIETAQEMIAHEPEFASWPPVTSIRFIGWREAPLADGRRIAHLRVTFAPAGTWPPSREAGLAQMANDLVSITGDMTYSQALAIVTAQVDVAGWPAAGAGMVADHEWTEWQMDRLAAAGAL